MKSITDGPVGEAAQADRGQQLELGQRGNHEQAAIWNGTGGCAWVLLQDSLDDLFRPIEDLLVASVEARAPLRVLDIGCGTGSTTVALAKRLGASGSSIGVDISEPMVAAARERSARDSTPARFIVADAEAYAFEPTSVDRIVSRFGVMFFKDPVRALANLRRAATAQGSLHFVVWRSAEDNPFMTTAERAAAALLPELPCRKPNEPGQFGFADAERVRSILHQAGWRHIDIRPLDVPCSMPQRQLGPYVSLVGPVGRLLQQADDELRARVLAAALPAFAPYVHGPEVRFTAACWMIEAATC